MALAFALDGVLYICLDKENLERMAAHDPFELDTRKMGTLALRFPLEVVVCTVTEEEKARLTAMTDDRAVKGFLFRGYRYTDEDRRRGVRQYEPLTKDKPQ